MVEKTNAMKPLILIFTFCVPTTLLTGQISLPNTITQQCMEAYAQNDLDLWADAISNIEEMAAEDPAFMLELAHAEYGAVSTCMGNDAEDQAKAYLRSAQGHVEAYTKKYGETADSKAILAGVMGLKIAFQPMKGMFLGPKIDRLLGQAIKENPESPIVQYAQGNSLVYTPEMWGGNRAQGIVHLSKTVELLERKGAEGTWLYLQSLAQLGENLQKEGRTAEAAATYRQALQVAPNFEWVKNYLLPELEATK